MPKPIREKSIDLISGILIIHMIFGHVLILTRQMDTPLYHWTSIVLSFFMPWFFFKSGMMYRDKGLNKTLSDGWRTLIKPYIIYSIIGQIVFIMLLLLSGRDFVFSNTMNFLIKNGAVEGNPPLWFLLSLFLVKIVFSFIRKHIDSRIILSAIAVSAFAFSYLQAGKDIPLTFQHTSSGLFFYIIGYLLKDIQFNHLLGLFTLLGYLGLQLILPTVVNMRGNFPEYGKYFLWPFSSLMGIVAINNITKRTQISSKTLEYVGKQSMFFYTWHWIIILCLQFINSKWISFEGWYYCTYIMTGTFINLVVMDCIRKHLIIRLVHV